MEAEFVLKKSVEVNEEDPKFVVEEKKVVEPPEMVDMHVQCSTTNKTKVLKNVKVKISSADENSCSNI